MREEYNALQKQGNWTLVPLPPHTHAIGCKWVFKLKQNSDGSIARYKVRLVAKGYLQEEGIDFHETFSPVFKQPTIRIFLSLALTFQWPVKQFDISNAFLHGLLDEEVFMLQPPGFRDATQPTHDLKLKKALYGLKQAPRAWYSTFSSFLVSQVFKNSRCDNSIFIHQFPSSLNLLLVYVADILITGSDASFLQTLTRAMHSVFSMKELGSISYFLGISVQPTGKGYYLSQHKCITELLAKAGMSSSKPCSTPIPCSSACGDSLPFSQPSIYKSIVGGLQCLTITRPDLAFAVNQACQHVQSPTNGHFQNVKRLLRYIKGTLNLRYHFVREKVAAKHIL